MTTHLATPAHIEVRLPLRLLAWGALGVALHVGMARFAYGVVLPSLRTEMGLGYTAGGVLNALHLAGYLVGTLLGPRLIRRYGVSRLVVAAHLLVAVGAFLCALAPANPGFGVVLLVIGRIATGVGAGPAVIAIMVSVLSSVAEPSRASASVLMWIGMAIAILGCGAGAPWLLQPGAWRLVFIAAALVALVLAFGFPVAKATPGDSGAGQGFTFASIATPRWAWLVLTYLCFGLGYIAYATFAGTRMAAAGAPLTVVAWAWATLGLATLCGGGITLWLLGKPRLRPYALPAAMAAASLGCVAAAMASAGAALAGAVGVGLGLAATPALVTAAARSRSNAADYARAFSIATAAMGVGQLIGPVVAGALADLLGSAAAPLFAAVAYGLGAVFAVMDRHAAR